MKDASQPPRDYYAVLQVHPDADTEVIEAAYRQLMKKHHPDRAGDDPQRIAEHLARAKLLNEAYSVLRNPEQRRQYDINCQMYGWQRHTPSTGTNPPQAAPPSAPPSSARDPASEPVDATIIVKPSASGLPGPLAVFSAAYYLLPGPYEWEEGSRRELMTVGLLPVAGVASFALVTGRLTPWIGQSLNATLLSWGLVVLLFLPMLGSLPRVAMAGAPSLLLLSGMALPYLQQVHVPIWFAWGMASLVSVILAARLFVFGVLPTVGVCWLISQVT